MEYIGMVVINDLGDPSDIHPRNKRDVGTRLAHQALQVIYGYENKVVQGQVLKKQSLKIVCSSCLLKI